jgi:hypothetical protein
MSPAGFADYYKHICLRYKPSITFYNDGIEKGYVIDNSTIFGVSGHLHKSIAV